MPSLSGTFLGSGSFSETVYQHISVTQGPTYQPEYQHDGTGHVAVFLAFMLIAVLLMCWGGCCSKDD